MKMSDAMKIGIANSAGSLIVIGIILLLLFIGLIVSNPEIIVVIALFIALFLIVCYILKDKL